MVASMPGEIVSWCRFPGQSQLGLKRKTKAEMEFVDCVTGSPVVKSADAKRMGKMAAFDLRLH
jgi:hypothetical protein